MTTVTIRMAGLHGGAVSAEVEADLVGDLAVHAAPDVKLIDGTEVFSVTALSSGRKVGSVYFATMDEARICAMILGGLPVDWRAASMRGQREGLGDLVQHIAVFCGGFMIEDNLADIAAAGRA